ncbi:hypothetical protein BBF96_10135 [Anoxybacter fermentans]|uniref:ABC transporter ATP-binding protein n=1 Tax=Anoxybacter fermentans TaxID=1323375 RepID=A0A3Q9HR30_9FIRM|nr:ABC transporter ATP-binding protein [Anoxybacter fermentans]AZR73710.1 hypothetical protein BBF96_10135 [Anoxybacter fermentans]
MRKDSFLRLFGFMKKLLPIYIISLLILSLLSLGSQILLANLFKDMFDAIALKNFTLMLNVVKYFGLIILVVFAIFPLFYYILDSTVATTTGNIRKAVFQHLQSLAVEYFKKGHSGNLISRLTNDIAETEKAYSKIFMDFVIQIVTGIGTAFYMFVLEWRLAIISIMSGFLTLIVNIWFARSLKRISDKVQQCLSNLTEKLSDLLNGIHVIRNFNLHKIILTKYNSATESVYEASYERVNKKAILSVLNSIVGIISFIGLVTMGSYLSIKGYISIGIVVAVVQLQNGINQLVKFLGSFNSQLQSSLAAAERLFEILDTEAEPINYSFRIFKNESDYIISFNNVTFGYDQNIKVLDHLNFSVPEGKIIALVGPSGGGKSTVFKLILGFYQPQKGDIILAGKFIEKLTLDEIRSKIAYVPQDAYLFSGTISENIGYGKNGATMEEIIEAAKIANAHDFITRLEKGYDTLVGERGTYLSGGQRQRIAIARAVLKNAPILLLDEATSALDTESEYLVQEALSRLMIGRTTLVIAHRLSTVQNADKILVLKDGKIVEEGTHEELLQVNGGVYRKLYYQQFIAVDNSDTVAVN